MTCAHGCVGVHVLFDGALGGGGCAAGTTVGALRRVVGTGAGPSATDPRTLVLEYTEHWRPTSPRVRVPLRATSEAHASAFRQRFADAQSAHDSTVLPAHVLRQIVSYGRQLEAEGGADIIGNTDKHKLMVSVRAVCSLVDHARKGSMALEAAAAGYCCCCMWPAVHCTHVVHPLVSLQTSCPCTWVPDPQE